MFEVAGDGEEVGEDTGEFFFVNSHMGFDAEPLARGLEPEDKLPHDGAEGTPVCKLEFRVDGFLVIAELGVGHFVGLDVGKFDEGREGGDDDGFDLGGIAGFEKERLDTVPLELAGDGLVVVAQWCIIEPCLIKTVVGL